MILFENVAKVYDETSSAALDDVSLEVERGEFVYLVGASGSGKSTFLQLVLREHKATSGRVLVAGKDVAQLSSWKVPHLRRQMGAVFQDFRLLPSKTVYENVAFALEVLGRPRSSIRKTVPETLEMVGLAGKERRLPHELSGGEQQRVAIARAFVNRPAILLADEPTGNLDPTTSRGIMRVLERINATGTTIVMATHDVVLVDEMRRRVIELENGRVIRDEAGGTYVTTSIPVIREEIVVAPVVRTADAVDGDGETEVDVEIQSVHVEIGEIEVVEAIGPELTVAETELAETALAETALAEPEPAEAESAEAGPGLTETGSAEAGLTEAASAEAELTEAGLEAEPASAEPETRPVSAEAEAEPDVEGEPEIEDVADEADADDAGTAVTEPEPSRRRRFFGRQRAR